MADASLNSLLSTEDVWCFFEVIATYWR